MLEKLLLAATVTFSLTAFIGLNSQVAPQPSTINQLEQPIRVAKNLPDRLLDHLSQ